MIRVWEVPPPVYHGTGLGPNMFRRAPPMSKHSGCRAPSLFFQASRSSSRAGLSRTPLLSCSLDDSLCGSRRRFLTADDGGPVARNRLDVDTFYHLAFFGMELPRQTLGGWSRTRPAEITGALEPQHFAPASFQLQLRSAHRDSTGEMQLDTFTEEAYVQRAQELNNAALENGAIRMTRPTAPKPDSRHQGLVLPSSPTCWSVA
jgi:hypothetical protein